MTRRWPGDRTLGDRMTDFAKLVPEWVHTLTSYKPGKPLRQAELESGVRCIKMASNENPFGPSPLAIEAIKAATAEVICYPIVTRATGARLIEVPTLNDGFDLDSILEAVDVNTRVIYIANPNNPTGTMLDANTIDRFLDRLPSHVIAVLDEAYYDYASYFAAKRRIRYSRSLEYVRQGRSVIVLRTFSKAHGLAGLRIGYGLGPEELIGYLARMRPAFMVSSLGEAAALAALADADHVRRSVEANAAGAKLLTEAISEMGISVTPSWTNFLFCRVGDDAGGLCQKLQGHGIIVRHMSGGWGAPNALRLTIGTLEHNEQFLDALKRVRLRIPA